MRLPSAAGLLLPTASRGSGALAVALLALASCADAASPLPRPFHPDAAACRPPTSAQAGWLPAEWAPFARAVRVCAIRDGARPAGLLVVSVWADAWYAPLPDGAVDVALPRPLLMAPDGRVLGTLPSNFPDDPPASLRLRFVGWHDGLPAEIRMCLASPTPAGDQPLAPLRWQSATHRYDKAGADPDASTQDECHAR
jgi:hypothetical protein